VLLQSLQGMVNSAAVSSGLSSWGVVLCSVLVVLVSAVLGEMLWTRLRYDMHKIPVAPNSVPVLGESSQLCKATKAIRNDACRVIAKHTRAARVKQAFIGCTKISLVANLVACHELHLQLVLCAAHAYCTPQHDTFQHVPSWLDWVFFSPPVQATCCCTHVFHVILIRTRQTTVLHFNLCSSSSQATCCCTGCTRTSRSGVIHLKQCTANSSSFLSMFAGHLLLYWMHKDFTQWFLKFHNTTKEPVLRVSVPHIRFVIVADPVIVQNVLGALGSAACLQLHGTMQLYACGCWARCTTRNNCSTCQ
jgi:hypothetical protein